MVQTSVPDAWRSSWWQHEPGAFRANPRDRAAQGAACVGPVGGRASGHSNGARRRASSASGRRLHATVVRSERAGVRSKTTNNLRRVGTSSSAKGSRQGRRCTGCTHAQERWVLSNYGQWVRFTPPTPKVNTKKETIGVAAAIQGRKQPRKRELGANDRGKIELKRKVKALEHKCHSLQRRVIIAIHRQSSPAMRMWGDCVL